MQVTLTLRLIQVVRIYSPLSVCQVGVGWQYSCYCYLKYSFLSPDQENSIKLREKNLQLNQEIHSKHQECCNLKEKFTTLSTENMNLNRQLARSTQDNRRLSKQVSVLVLACYHTEEHKWRLTSLYNYSFWLPPVSLSLELIDLGLWLCYWLSSYVRVSQLILPSGECLEWRKQKAEGEAKSHCHTSEGTARRSWSCCLSLRAHNGLQTQDFLRFRFAQEYFCIGFKVNLFIYVGFLLPDFFKNYIWFLLVFLCLFVSYVCVCSKTFY